MTDVRCGATGGLMFKVRDDGSLEIACEKCRDADRKAGKRTWLVLHIYDPDTFELVDTEHLTPLPARPR